MAELSVAWLAALLVGMTAVRTVAYLAEWLAVSLALLRVVWLDPYLAAGSVVEKVDPTVDQWVVPLADAMAVQKVARLAVS